MSFQDADPSTVKVWDSLVRVFHWSLVFFFLIALITEDDWLNLHVQAAYAASFIGMIIITSEENGPLAGTVIYTLRGDWMEDVNPGNGKGNQP